MIDSADFKVYTLFSGSSGNSVYICTEKTQILIDAGVSARAICSALNSLGTDITELDAIFVTHDHIDHVRGLEVISKKHSIPVHMTEQTAEVCIRDPEGMLARAAVLHQPGFECSVGDINISSFRTPHDSAMSVGYVAETANGKRMGLATDIGFVPPQVKDALYGCDYVILESNYDEQMLSEGMYPYQLKRRIMSKYGHLSNDESACFAADLAASGTKNIMLAHLSRENNTPELAYESAYRSVYLRGFSDSVRLSVADREHPTRLI